MAYVSRGFHGKREKEREDSRLPPGQYLSQDFPVLSAGPTPHTPLDEWSFTIESEVGEELERWSWESFRALPPRRCGSTSTASRSGRNWTRRGRACRSTRSWMASSTTQRTRWPSPTATTSRTSRSRTCSTGRPGSRSRTTARRWSLSTEARAAPGSTSVLLEEREVGAGSAAVGPRRAGVLGVLRLSHLR